MAAFREAMPKNANRRVIWQIRPSEHDGIAGFETDSGRIGRKIR
jgi:hypothetical protein